MLRDGTDLLPVRLGAGTESLEDLEGLVQYQQRCIPAVSPPANIACQTTRASVCHWTATSLAEGLTLQDLISVNDPGHHNPVVTEADVCLVPIAGPFQSGKSTVVESLLLRATAEPLVDTSGHGLNGDNFSALVDLSVPNLYTTRWGRPDEEAAVHQHYRLSYQEADDWIRQDHWRPVGSKELVFADRISYFWYLLSREELAKCFRFRVDPTTGKVVKKLIVFPATLELAAIFKMLFPSITHTLALYPNWCFTGAEPGPRPDTPRLVNIWRRELYNPQSRDLVLADAVQAYNYIGLYDTLCVPLDFKHQRYVEAKVDLDQYRYYLGYGIATVILAIFRMMTGGSDWAKILDPNAVIALQDVDFRRRELLAFQAAESDSIEALAEQRKQRRLPSRYDLTAPVRRLNLPYHDIVYPGRRYLPPYIGAFSSRRG